MRKIKRHIFAKTKKNFFKEIKNKKIKYCDEKKHI